MNNKLTQKEIFCSNEFYEIIKKYSFTRNVNLEEINQAKHAYVKNAYIEKQDEVEPKYSNFLRSLHIVMNTTFMYEYDDKFFGIYEKDGKIAIVKFYYGWELQFVGSSVTNFFQEAMVYMERDLANEASEFVSEKYNISFKGYKDPECKEYDDDANEALYKSIENDLNLQYPDFNIDYPEFTAFFESDIYEPLYYSMIRNNEKFSKNSSIRLQGVCCRIDDLIFQGECVVAVDVNKDDFFSLFYSSKYFSHKDIEETKKHLIKRGHFCFEMIIDYETDKNNKIIIIKTKIKKIK